MLLETKQNDSKFMNKYICVYMDLVEFDGVNNYVIISNEVFIAVVLPNGFATVSSQKSLCSANSFYCSTGKRLHKSLCCFKISNSVGSA